MQVINAKTFKMIINYQQKIITINYLKSLDLFYRIIGLQCFTYFCNPTIPIIIVIITQLKPGKGINARRVYHCLDQTPFKTVHFSFIAKVRGSCIGNVIYNYSPKEKELPLFGCIFHLIMYI